ncbi:hypothetical protein H9L12_03895 [Sphingomonas rhizophila]|uniref:Serine kinase n=1 Tax=Sphingomonas rhizophila TaxID=2071607 RepID=A0A7G9SCY6_9SPHN|nr:hypothetical protein [Sphingomonas rhizophila]QNN65711.1 hypothetical protein H9L12_03895 [Sphingomonas rhizophila]
MNGQDARYDYRLFGLRIRSDRRLPELVTADELGKPDVMVTSMAARGAVSEQPPTIEQGAVVFAVEGVARYAIAGGQSVSMEVVEGADARDVRMYLLGSALGFLMQQRGVLPIHANAVVIDGRAVLFMGGSGEGKSTLASWFHQCGMEVLADDVAAISFDACGRPVVHAGLARLRLWDDALEATGRTASDYQRSFAGDEQRTKYDVPLEGASTDRSYPVAAIYELRAGEMIEVERLRGSAAFERLVANIYRGAFLAKTDPTSRYWISSTRLVEAVPVFAAHRPWSLDRFDDSAEAILAHARSITA